MGWRRGGWNGALSITASGARLREHWEIRLGDQCFFFSPLSSTDIEEAPLSCWLNNCHPICRTGDNGEEKRPLRLKKRIRKSTFFTLTSMSGGEAGSLQPINNLHCHFPILGVAWRVLSKFVLLCTSSLITERAACFSPCCVLTIWAIWLHQQTDDSHSLRLNCVTSVTAFTPVL